MCTESRWEALSPRASASNVNTHSLLTVRARMKESGSGCPDSFVKPGCEHLPLVVLTVQGTCDLIDLLPPGYWDSAEARTRSFLTVYPTEPVTELVSVRIW